MAMINLINLLPIMPLDGGRVLRSISFSFGSWRGLILIGIGMIAGAAILMKMGFWLFVILIPFGIIEVVFDFKKERKNPEKLVKAQSTLENFREYIRNGSDGTASYFQSRVEELEEGIKRLSARPNMSAAQLKRGIVWALVLAVSLFLVIHYASVITGDESFIDILR
ncbi:MAG: hypothetical protein A3D46_00670 [Candidatus Nealsonbacteria bacterium RIFCSPHIGHO2_02_FULL_43_13]|uniref:Peptidase M50 domain-containing protein n=1 Tax=Candidatus Nealsonbacteria bacterium RIFCSPHIGHO2_02_FULL_43_13 TaxID=1801668 RepID=A0A1G2E7L0_9BACT|nr:MAG: hypothetical protein A3D46_00670 [Candidatus Nealsonbacteria bacterium RIFCSPHIGHO2_02_FULL_43_13]